MPKRTVTGVVKSDKSAKCRRVEVPRQVRHAKYGKILHRKTVCYVHDEANESRRGDTVEIRECRPRSRTKRWELVRVVGRADASQAAALQEAERLVEQEEGSAGSA
jgi:small subunit ribosomal protein S17